MMTATQENNIKLLLASSNSKEVIQKIIEEYTKESISNCQFLLGLIPDIANRSIHILEKESRTKSEAIFMMMFERIAEIQGNEDIYFASMVPVCMAHFPEGNARRRSEAEREYFKLFCELFKNKKAFSWDRDKDWADSYNYTNYLRLVEKQMNEESKTEVLQKFLSKNK